MYPTREPSAIFGLRYLEEEDLEINDIVGCQTAAANPHPAPEFTNSQYTTYTDVTDSDRDNDPI